MIVDSSALPAALNRQPDADGYQAAILNAVPCRMSVASVLEVSIVVESRGGPEAGDELEAFLETAGIEPTPVTVEQLAAVRRAWRRFGRGRHPAALNLGDCVAYALAQVTGEPLLYKGGDFARTDVLRAALPRQGLIADDDG